MQKIDTFFSPPRRKRGRPKKKKATADKKPGRRPAAVDLTPDVQSLLSPGGTTRLVKKQGSRTGARQSYAAHTVNGKKMILILERWGREMDEWPSISKFAKAMAVEHFDELWRWETIRQRLGKRSAKSLKGLDDKRSLRSLLVPTTRQALGEVLALKDEKSEGGSWKDLCEMIAEIKPDLKPTQVGTAALSVLREGRKESGPIKKNNMRAQRHTSKRCEVCGSPFLRHVLLIALIVSSCADQIECTCHCEG